MTLSQVLNVSRWNAITLENSRGTLFYSNLIAVDSVAGKVQRWIQIMQSTDTPTKAANQLVGQCTFLLQSIVMTADFKYAQTDHYCSFY